MMFKNAKHIDETIIGTINECRLLFSGGIIKLFENVKLDDDFEKNNVINFEDYHGNKIAYFNDVKNLFENNQKEFKTSLLFESVNTFKDELEEEINILLNMNDFNKLSKLNPLVLKTKLFTKQTLNVYGFDLRNFNKILSENDIKNCFCVAYCMTHHKLYFVIEDSKDLYIYDIFSGKLKNETLKTSFNKKNYIKLLNQNFSNNIIELETNVDVDILSEDVTDNLFNDNAIRYIKTNTIRTNQRKNITEK